MARTCPALALGLLVALAAPPAGAGETPAAVTAYVERAAALPAPGEAYALDLDCDVVVGEQTLGRATFRAEPVPGEGEAAGTWEVHETMALMGGSMRREVKATLGAHLEPLRGSITGTTPEAGPFRVTWERTEAGFRVATRQGEGEEASETETTHAHAGPSLCTISALWVFCRMSLQHPATYQVPIFEPDPTSQEGPFETGIWTIGPKSTWGEVPAFVVKGTKGDKARMETGFHAETGAFLGARFMGDMPAAWEFRPRAAAAEEPEPAPSGTAYKPARNARDAALQAALGFGSGDVKLLEQAIHWPSVHAALRAAHEEEFAGVETPPPFPELEALKAEILASWEKALPRNPAPMIQMAIQMAQGALQEEAHEGFTRVRFPEIFRNLELDVAEVDGIWYLVHLPASPK